MFGATKTAKAFDTRRRLSPLLSSFFLQNRKKEEKKKKNQYKVVSEGGQSVDGILFFSIFLCVV